MGVVLEVWLAAEWEERMAVELVALLLVAELDT